MSVTEISITACLHEMSSRLTDAAAIGKAALVCAENGSEREGLRIAMDLDELLHQVQTLHGAVCLIGRISRQDDLRSVMPG
jgi:hypothetical protein